MTAGKGPRFSIVIAAFNSEATLSEAIDSVLGQTAGDFELIVVDDGSTDATPGTIAGYAERDSRVRGIRQDNAGVAAARNRGLGEARGDWLVLLDADDVLLPEYLERQSAFMQAHTGFDIYSCNALYLLDDGRRIPVWRGERFGGPLSLTAEDQIAESSILLMSVFSPRVLDLTGGFRDLHAEDYDFWLRALILGAKHVFNPDTLALYRRHEASRSRQLVLEAESFLRIQREALVMPELTESQRAALLDAIAFSEARLGRRRLEERLLASDYSHARRDYVRYRSAFPNLARYLLGLGIMLLSPSAYARIKRERMI